MLLTSLPLPCLQGVQGGPPWRDSRPHAAVTPRRARGAVCRASQNPLGDERRLVDSNDAPSMAADLGGNVSEHASAVDYTVSPETPLGSVDWHGHTGLVVVGKDGKPVGVLSDKNVPKAVMSTALCVHDVMTPHPITILETAPVAIAAALMKDHGASSGNRIALSARSFARGVFR